MLSESMSILSRFAILFSMRLEGLLASRDSGEKLEAVSSFFSLAMNNELKSGRDVSEK